MATTEPQKWSATLGASADVNVLPATTPTGSGRASTSGLFPPVTQLPLDQGGIAPERGDFNALFKYLGEYLFYSMQGGVYTYVTTYNYTAGNFVLHEGSLYLCIAANGPGSVIKYPTDAAYWRRLALMSDIPAVPTVNNGTLTIQKDGITVATFTANQAGNTTANITISEIDSQSVSGERGWVRFKSGVQIVWGYGSDNTPITFPRAFFHGDPSVSGTCTTDLDNPRFLITRTRSATGVMFRVWDPTISTWNPDGTFTYIAIGFWK